MPFGSYLHPSDAKWATAEKPRKQYGLGDSFNAPKASRMRTSDSSTPLPARRPTPLVPQSHLFRLNAESDYSDAKSRRSSYNYDNGDFSERGRGSKPYGEPLGPESRNADGKKTERRLDSGSSNWSKLSSSRRVRDIFTLI